MNLIKTTKIKNTLSNHNFSVGGIFLIIGLTLIEFFMIVSSAMAHHPMGGKTPNNLMTGLLSGLGHPIIGLDHFAFVVASGLVVIGMASFWFVPTAFVVTAIFGTMIHLQSVDLPLAETTIALSVILFGILIALKNNWQSNNPIFALILTALAGFAGLFHGYAYGEAIIGAELTPLVAYLIGFTIIQLAIAFSAYYLGSFLVKKISEQKLPLLKLIGLSITSIGLVYLLA